MMHEILAEHQEQVQNISKLIGYILSDLPSHSGVVSYNEKEDTFQMVVWYKAEASLNSGRMLKGATYDEFKISRDNVIISDNLVIKDKSIYHTHYAVMMERVKTDEVERMKQFFTNTSVKTGYSRIHKLDQLGVNKDGEL
jgi:hypothetical protein